MASEAQLLAMGLSSKDINDGTFINSGKWPEKAALQTAIGNSTLCVDKPEGDELFVVAKPTTNLQLAKCNLMIPVAKVSAIIPAGNTSLVLDEEAILAKREGAEWSLEKMTWSKGDTKDSKYMKVASSPDTYADPQYFDYVPIKVRNATATFRESY